MPLRTDANAVSAIIALYREFEQRARGGEISLAQYRLLLYLRNGPKRAGAIAATYDVTRPTISLALSVLREKNWVANILDPATQRFIVVTITPEGLRQMTIFEEEMVALLGELLPDEVRAIVRDAMAKVFVELDATKEVITRSVEDHMRIATARSAEPAVLEPAPTARSPRTAKRSKARS